MKFPTRILAWTISILSASAALAEDAKETVNSTIRALRTIQNADGSYGTAEQQPLATARVLQALGACGEHYTVQDGPFVRRAVEVLLARQQADGALVAQGSGRRALDTAEALKGIRAVAPGTYAEETARAAKWLEDPARGPEAAREAAALGLDALGGGADGAEAELAAVRALAGAAGGAGAAAVKATAERIARAQAAFLAAPAAAGALDAATRLVALVEVLALEPAKQAAPAAALAEPTLRAAPASRDDEVARAKAGLEFLGKTQQKGVFAISGQPDPGVSGLALAAALRTCAAYGFARPAWIDEGLAYLAGLQKADGGIYDKGLKNYVTSVAIEALTAAGDAAYRPAIERAVGFLKATQLDSDEGYSAEEDPYYGGFGYGSAEKPDLSNTQMALQALHDAGIAGDDDAFKKAVLFLERCQNRAETGAPPMPKSDGTVVVAGTDGGAVYRPGDSKAGVVPGQGNEVVGRSYGSMTYALLKCYLFAGLDPKDARVQSAIQWIQQNFTVSTNPGFEPTRPDAPYQALFYYYLTLARALNAYGQDTITDSAGKVRDWRAELRAMLFQLQREEGLWINDRSSRWLEGNPVLTTSYALLALVETE